MFIVPDESSFCNRNCCMNFRHFRMEIQDMNQQPLIVLNRPFRYMTSIQQITFMASKFYIVVLFIMSRQPFPESSAEMFLFIV